MFECSRCDDEPAILSFGDMHFCSLECMTEEIDSKEERLQLAEQMFSLEQ